MFAFLKSIPLPFNKKIMICLSIIASVLAILYLTGLTKFRTKPIWETYADEEVAEEKPKTIGQKLDEFAKLF